MQRKFLFLRYLKNVKTDDEEAIYHFQDTMPETTTKISFKDYNNLNKHTLNACTNTSFHNLSLKLKSLVYNSKVNCAQICLNNFNLTAKHLFFNSGKQVRHSMNTIQEQIMWIIFIAFGLIFHLHPSKSQSSKSAFIGFF